MNDQRNADAAGAGGPPPSGCVWIVNFSGGACSFWAAHRAIERVGKENVVLLFADTNYEHKDLYDFNKHAVQVLGVPITRISAGFKPWTLFDRKNMIGNDRFPICSIELKREPLNRWMESRYEMDRNQSNMLKRGGAVVLGFDWTEEHRVQAFRAQHPTWHVWAPMLEEPIWDKCRMLAECEKLGFTTPTLYKLGFPHNNCGGFCVKAGISHYVHLYKTMPSRYREIEGEEYRTQQSLRKRGAFNWQFTVLKDRRNGKTRPLTFTELRQRIESGETFSNMEWGGCGCGGEQPETHSQNTDSPSYNSY